MKVKLKSVDKFFNPEEIQTTQDFIKFLQSQLSLSDDILIEFDGVRKDSEMTTGVRLPKNEIRVLAKDRMLVDVLRTIAHEWVHEYQHQKMGLKDTDKIQDIGGPEENMSNVLAGIYIKKFSKLFPGHKVIMFGDNS